MALSNTDFYGFSVSLSGSSGFDSCSGKLQFNSARRRVGKVMFLFCKSSQTGLWRCNAKISVLHILVILCSHDIEKSYTAIPPT